MPGVYYPCGNVAGFDLIGCEHAERLFVAYPGKSTFETLSLSHQEWLIIVKPGRRSILLECKRCTGGI